MLPVFLAVKLLYCYALFKLHFLNKNIASQPRIQAFESFKQPRKERFYVFDQSTIFIQRSKLTAYL